MLEQTSCQFLWVVVVVAAVMRMCSVSILLEIISICAIFANLLQVKRVTSNNTFTNVRLPTIIRIENFKAKLTFKN